MCPFPFLLSYSFLISSLVCLFLSTTPYCFSCFPHLTWPLFLCPPLHWNNVLLTAFQLLQGLRGWDSCSMLMSEPRHWKSAAHRAKERGGMEKQGDEAMSKWHREPKIKIPWKLSVSMIQICLLYSYTSTTAYKDYEVMYSTPPDPSSIFLQLSWRRSSWHT